MATLTVRPINFGTYTPGATPTNVVTAVAALDTANNDGDDFIADSRTYLEFAQTANPGIVNIVAQHKNEDGVLMHVRVPTTIGNRYKVGPFDSHYIHTDGKVHITYPAATQAGGITIAPFRLAEKGQ